MRSVSCPACDRQGGAAVIETDVPGLGKVRLVRCARCGMGYLDPQPEPDEIAPFYASEYYGGSGTKFVATVERMRSAMAKRRARRLARGLPPGARVLDVGCGDGRLLEAFAALGFRGVGTERAGRRPRALTSQSDIEVLAGDLTTTGLEPGQFDLGVFWHVLEHLHDPLASLQEAARVLRPGGRLVVAVPNLDSFQARWTGRSWFHLDLPRHLFHFTPGSLTALLSRAGFRVEHVGHFSFEQNPFGILQSALNRLGGGGAPVNRLYETLKGNTAGARAAGRLAARAAYWLGMPPATLLATLESLVRRGGTIEAWAERAGDAPADRQEAR
ncbi:MAG: class I SAM-dependent methyltransferase [Deltaproteobacteria bacterium]|nr:class I SAM-dependent methyltransferase [Deltaproteobacteria bacterium]